MKKIFVCSLLSLATITLVGCGANASASVVKDLGNQLERVENCLAQSNEQDLSSICSQYSTSTTDPLTTSRPLYTTSLNLLNLQTKVSNDVAFQNEFCKHLQQKIADLQSSLKDSDNQYNQNQIKAIKNLSSQLSAQANNLKNSKQDFKDGLNIIRKNRSVNHTSIDQLNSGYNSINSALEMRKAYYFNIATTLSQLEGVLDNKLLDDNDKSLDEGTQDEQQPKNINIPTPAAQQEQQPVAPVYPAETVPNRFWGRHRFGNYPYGYGYGTPAMPYGPMYNYGQGYYGFNPTRNTDSYRPNYVNIDTYRWTKNGSFPGGEYQVEIVSNIPFEVDTDLPDEQQVADQTPSIPEKLMEQNKQILNKN